MTHECKYLGIDFCSHGTLSHLAKDEEITSMKVFMGSLRKEAIVRVTCWERNAIYSRLWCFQLSHVARKIWGGHLKTLIGRFLRIARRCICCLTSKCILQIPIILCEPNLENSHRIISSQAHYKLSMTVCPPSPL